MAARAKRLKIHLAVDQLYLTFSFGLCSVYYTRYLDTAKLDFNKWKLWRRGEVYWCEVVGSVLRQLDGGEKQFEANKGSFRNV